MEDGRWHHRLRQSWLKTASLCLERARREHVDIMPERETDAACLGTAVHAGIELCIEERLDLASTQEAAQRDFSGAMQGDTFAWVKYTEKSARKFINTCLQHWHEQVLPTLEPDPLLEWRFEVPLHEDEERVIELSGQVDYLDTGVSMIDWKTSGGLPWQKWEHERWDIQATVYTYAGVAAGMLEPAWDKYEFEFVVMSKKGVDRIKVTRRPEDWEWLKHKCIEMAHLIESDVPSWPTNDTHALCSPKWCPAWDDCKGLYVHENWPR